MDPEKLKEIKENLRRQGLYRPNDERRVIPVDEVVSCEECGKVIEDFTEENDQGELVIHRPISSLPDAVIHERDEQWHKDRVHIPAIEFPSGWKITIWPPFAGATIRFLVNETVSVYLDFHGALAPIEEPYWEIYPDKNGDNSRYDLFEIDELIFGIQQGLDSREEKSDGQD